MPEFPSTGPVTVDIRIAAGAVEVHAEPRDITTVEVAPYDNDRASQEAAEQTRVELSGDTLTIAAPEDSGWLLRRSPRLRVTARVPAASNARIRVASADVGCHGEWSQVKLNSAAGDAQVARVTGDLSVHTASGDLRVAQVGGEFTVHTASGGVSARQAAGPVDIKSASGDVRIDDAGADVTVKTASGDVEVVAARRGTIRATTVSGDVQIGVVSGTGVWMDLNTLSGRTRSDLGVAGDTPPASHDLTLQLRTVSGNIDIHRVTLPASSASI